MKKLKWWLIFLVDIFLIICTSIIAGIIFAIQAFMEDIMFSWNRTGH